jgi:two-component system repressor protein LuxO
MPIDLQGKLLRFLQERVYRRVGGSRDIQSHVRVLSATNRDPLDEVREGRMRDDLYYRLHVVPIDLPPLRERVGDISLLATTALTESSQRYEKNFRSIDPAVIQRLEGYDWPGNVRQLFHLIERCVVLNQGPLLKLEMLPSDLQDVPSNERGLEQPIHPSPVSASLDSTEAAPPDAETVVLPLAELEKRAIEHALRVCEGSATEAARLLGISAATIYRKVKSFDSELPSS